MRIVRIITGAVITINCCAAIIKIDVIMKNGKIHKTNITNLFKRIPASSFFFIVNST